MNDLSLATQKPTSVRYGVLGFACALSMITYLDRVCFGTVKPFIQSEFDLTKTEVGMLFTAFALAYAAFEVPTGWLGDIFGPRVTLIRIVLWWSAFTALTGMIFPSAQYPLLAFGALLLVRFLFGVGEAGAFPNISCAFARWFPLGERGRAQGAVWMAGRFGGGVTPLVVLTLVYTTQHDDVVVKHWRHIFWIFGVLGVMWCVAFYLWFRDRPQQHPSVNAAEVALIEGGGAVLAPLDLAAATRREGDEHVRATLDQLLAGSALTGLTETAPPAPHAADEDHGSHSPRNVPWGRLLTDLNLWTLCIMYFGCAYGWYFNITWLPGYLGEKYGVSEKTHGFWAYSLMAGAPLLLGSLACLLGGLLTDAFIRRTGNRKWGRRLFGMIGHSVCALCYFLSLGAGPMAAALGEERLAPWLFVFFVAMAAFWNDLTMGAAWASCIDVGGRYSGIVSGCMNTIGNLGGAVAGVSTGFILDRFGDERGWTINFVSFGMVYVIAVFLWMRFDATKQVPQSA